jgi:hypothetical protein
LPTELWEALKEEERVAVLDGRLGEAQFHASSMRSPRKRSRGGMTRRRRIAWDPLIMRAAAIVAAYATAVTLRQLHYRLVAEAVITGSGYLNTDSHYKHLSRLTARERRRGAFPPLLDLTRTIQRPQTWTSPAAALATLASVYRRDLLSTQETLPLVVVEKATLVTQAVSWFGDLCIPVVALRGYASESLERLLLDLVMSEERQIELLYCGDFDPTGEDIPRAFEDNTGLRLRRVALDAVQVEDYGLPPALGKTTDSRAFGFEARHGRLVPVELEALDPNDLRALLAAEINALVDDDLVEAERRREEEEQARLARLTSAS